MTKEAREAQRILQSLRHMGARTFDIEERMRSGEDQEGHLAAEHAALIRRREEIGKAISAMEREEEKRMIELRYMDARSWVDITRRMHISKSASFRMHETALLDFLQAYKKSPGHCLDS